MYSGGGGDGGLAENEAKRQAKIDEGMKIIGDRFSSFNEPFYKERADAYTSFANPQMMQQFRDTNNSLTSALARSGLLKSSAAQKRRGQLDTELAKAESTIANSAQDQANQLREQVGAQRSNVVSQLVASADPSIAATQSLAAANALRAPSVFQPLGNAFADFTGAYLANQTARSYNPSTPNMWQMMGLQGQGGSGGSSIRYSQ